MDIKAISAAVSDLFLPYKFGFIAGHYYLDNARVTEICDCLGSEKRCAGAVSEYEGAFAACVGSGRAMSFAAGRMAFFSLLKSLGIKPGDEVILPAFTCSVMPNAVWRSGARPVFADIDPDTFGSCAESIEKVITKETRIIVAQHSFGIPCRIKAIMDLARKRGIFVIEDCAIAFDSSTDGIKVGNFGDAAFFSTDHTKPLNTMTGGMLYSNNIGLVNKIREQCAQLPSLDGNHQKRLYSQFLFERSNAAPDKYPGLIIKKFIKERINRMFSFCARNSCTFLEADYTKSGCAVSPYPYPAKLPDFLARLGLFELDRWKTERAQRKLLLREYLTVCNEVGMAEFLPRAYFNDKLDIVPLRFVFKDHRTAKGASLARFIDSRQAWFRQPVICCPEGVEKIGYMRGSCLESETVCRLIENWPCVVREQWVPKIVELFRSTYS